MVQSVRFIFDPETGNPQVVSAEKTSDEKCRVEIELPENVDVEDTSTLSVFTTLLEMYISSENLFKINRFLLK